MLGQGWLSVCVFQVCAAASFLREHRLDVTGKGSGSDAGCACGACCRSRASRAFAKQTNILWTSNKRCNNTSRVVWSPAQRLLPPQQPNDVATDSYWMRLPTMSHRVWSNVAPALLLQQLQCGVWRFNSGAMDARSDEEKRSDNDKLSDRGWLCGREQESAAGGRVSAS